MRPVIGIPLRSTQKGTSSMEYIYEKVKLPIQNLKTIILPIPYVQTKDIWKTNKNELKELTEIEKEEILFFLEQCDGLFLPGGEKFVEQDCFLYQEAVKRNIPVLAVCLSMQAISTIGQDIQLKKIETTMDHHRRKNCKYAHPVTIKKDSILYSIVQKETIMVNSFHIYEAMENERFEVVATSPDGVIEAIEPKEDQFVLALQWHPELMEKDLNMQKILNAFYKQAYLYHEKRNEKRIHSQIQS